MKNTIYTFLLLFFFSCANDVKPPKTKQELMDDYLKEKVGRWLSSTKNTCIEKVNERAEAIVDSLLILEAKQEAGSITKPTKPLKPPKPQLKEASDTLPLAPLFDTLQ